MTLFGSKLFTLWYFKMASPLDVRSEVLCFVQNNIDNTTLANLLTWICGFYTTEEVTESKNLLFTVADGTCKASTNQSFVLPRNISRRNGDGRRKLDAEDLLDLWATLDAAKVILPTFTAANLKRVPEKPLTDTDLCLLTMNVLDLKTQLLELKNLFNTHPTEWKSDVDELKSNISTLSTEVSSLKSHLNNVYSAVGSVHSLVSQDCSRASGIVPGIFTLDDSGAPKVHTNEARKLASNSTADVGTSNFCSNETNSLHGLALNSSSGSNRHQASHPRSNILWADMVQSGSGPECSSAYNVTRMNSKVPSADGVTDAGKTALSVDDGFTTYLGRRPNKPTRPRVTVCGKRSTDKLLPVPRRVFVSVRRLHTDTEEKDLCDFMLEAGITNPQCKKLLPKEGQKFFTSAFMVSCDVTSRDLLFDENTWPTGCEVRDWYFKQRKKTD